MCVCVFPETTTHFESLLSRIKAASKERKRERRTTTTNALRLVGLGRRSPGYVFCILLLLKRCEEITTTHSFIIVAFFLSCFFFVSISNEIKMEKNHRWFLPLKHSQIKKEVRVKKVPNQTTKKKSMKTLNRDLRKKKHMKRQKRKVEYGLKEKLF